MSAPRPFRVEIPQATINAIAKKVQWYEMPEAPGAEDSWAYGASLAFMKGLCRYWLEDYDWRRWEAELNRFPQYMAPVDGIDIHFYREEGSGPAPKPLILSHGWPGSVFEFLHIVDKLAHPERSGGDAKDAFTVIVPSLPGYGFSGKPKRPIGPRTVARMFDTLMTEMLKLPGYIAQGGDWGAAISGWMGYEGKGCRAVHLNMMGWQAPGVKPETEQEREHAARAGEVFEAEDAYFRIQSRKPLTLAYAMMDSPAGICAWIVEKFYAWSDIRAGFEELYSKDRLLTNVMIYLVTKSFDTSTWLYRGLFEDLTGAPIPPGARIEKPVAIARFPVDLITFPPRSQVEKSMNVVRWTEFKEGGHFAALERPDDLVKDIRAFARSLG